LEKGDHRGIEKRKRKYISFYKEGIPLVPPFEKKGGHMLT
jgi:hypothetical protein